MKARIVWLILCGIWGSTWLFIKIGLADLPPITFAGIRFVIASLILTSLVLARRAPLPRTRRDWTLIAISGVLQFALNYGLVFWGEQRIPSGLAAVLQSTFPAFGLVIAHLYLPAERITGKKVIGVLLAGKLNLGVKVDRSPVPALRDDAGDARTEAILARAVGQQHAEFRSDARPVFVLQASRPQHMF